jgi:hypothetical protein
MLKLMWAPSLSDGLCSHVIRNTSSKVRNRRQWRSGAVPDRRELATVLTARQGPRRIAGSSTGPILLGRSNQSSSSSPNLFKSSSLRVVLKISW